MQLIESQGFVYNSIATAGLVGGFGMILFYLYSTTTGRGTTSSSGKKSLSPPRVKLGLVGCIKMMTSNQKPWKLLKLAKELDSFLFQLNLSPLFRVPMIVVGEPKLARQVLTDPLSIKPPEIYGSLAQGLNNGTQSMFTSNGDFWHSRRRGMAPAFSAKHIKRMNAVAEKKVDEWIKTRLLKFIENDQAFDVSKEMIRVVFDAIIETGFEYQISVVEREEFLYELDLALKEFTNKSIANPLRRMFGRFLAERRRAHLSSKRVRMFGMKLMNSYRQLKNPMNDTIIDKIMSNPAYKNDTERAADITSLLVASFETTANTISWILKELAKNTKEQEDLRESLNSLSPEEWRQSDVLRKVVKECMRLHPVAAGGPKRIIGRDFVTDSGMVLQKGSVVDTPFILILRNSNVFKDANSFLPSRWDDPTKAMDEAFFPFALGRQNCIGQSLANAEIYSLIPRICSEFELELVDEGYVDFFLTLKSLNTMIKAKKIS